MTVDSCSRGTAAAAPAAGRGAVVAVMIPVFNDWEACAGLLRGIDSAFRGEDYEVHVLLVDDGSELPETLSGADADRAAIRTVRILRLRRNVGHQRAIGIGIAHVAEHLPCDALVIMDGDGEDAPEDAVRLLRHCRGTGWKKIVFAERSRRSEGFSFRFSYQIYRLVHRLLTGRRIRVGNFSVIPRRHLGAMVTLPDLWNHYAAAVFNSRLPADMLPTSRAKRLAGISRMNFVQLVMHGLSAISVFGDLVGTRLMILCAGLGCVLTAAIGVVVAVRLFTDLAIPGWATSTIGWLLTILFQVFVLASVFSLLMLGSRSRLDFLPLRDYAYFVEGVELIHPPRRPAA